MRSLAAMLSAVIFLALPVFAETTDIELEVGQVWTYRNAELSESRLTIRKLEQNAQGEVVHVSIAPIAFRPTKAGQVIGGMVGHLPFTREAVLAALIEQVGRDDEPSPLFEDGYAQWRDDGGGVFTISPAEAVEFVYVAAGASADIND